jgi:Predicted membrane protein
MDDPAPSKSGLAPILERNIQALIDRRRGEERARSVQDRVAGAITRFTGSMTFVYIHLVFFGGWIIANLPFVPFPKWDPTLVVLAMVASVEAIFLSTFVLITQNRISAEADKRADLDLHISLLAEHELTRLIALTSALAEKLEVHPPDAPDIDAAKNDIIPEAVLGEIEARKEKSS